LNQGSSFFQLPEITQLLRLRTLMHFSHIQQLTELLLFTCNYHHGRTASIAEEFLAQSQKINLIFIKPVFIRLTMGTN
jgi:hypothetical protein